VGYTVDSKLLQFGGQKQLAPGWFLGGSIAYDSSDYAADNVPAQVDGQGVTLGAVLKRQDGPWILSGAVDAGYGWYDSSRTVSLGTAGTTATASFNGQHAGLHGRIAYQLPQDGWYLKPYLDLHAIWQRTEAYTESGAGALDLSVSRSSATQLVASPMLELGGRFDLGPKLVLKPVLGIGGSFFNKNEWNTQVRFVGSPSAPIEVSSSLPSALFNLNLGATLMSGDNLHLRLDYSGQFGSNYRSNGGSLKLSYLF
jgi:outer membrane autotransporter protein